MIRRHGHVISALSPLGLLAAGIALLGVASLAVSACGSDESGGALDELRRVAPVSQGNPQLVFVYTDG